MLHATKYTFPVKYNKTLIESKLCGEKKVPQDRPEECQNELESIRVEDVLWLKLFRIPILRKTKFGKYLTAVYSSSHESK